MDADITTARAVADLTEGLILATVEVAAAPERAFRALASPEIVEWWVRPGVFDTAEWAGDVRPGGAWRASGTGNGSPYTLEGEFRQVDSPGSLVHTWRPVGAPVGPTTVTYTLEPVADGARITLRHTGFVVREMCVATCLGWETSFRRLAEWLAAEPPPSQA